MLRKTMILAMALVLGTRAASAQEFKIVVNEANSHVLTKQLVSGIFLGSVKSWPDGTSAAPVDLPEKSTVRAAFSTEILGRDTKAVANHWLKEIYSGRSIPPVSKDKDGAVIDWVRGNAGAIGYVSGATAIPAGVKVVGVK